MSKIRDVALLLGISWHENESSSYIFRLNGDLLKIDYAGVVNFLSDANRKYNMDDLIVKSRYIQHIEQPPKLGEIIYVSDIGVGKVYIDKWKGEYVDLWRYKMNLISKTKEQAVEKLKYYQEVLEDNLYMEEK